MLYIKSLVLGAHKAQSMVVEACFTLACPGAVSLTWSVLHYESEENSASVFH